MEIKICSKFNIGDIVRKYEKRYVHESKIQCPLCKGEYQVENPNWNWEEDEEGDYEYLECPHCIEGWIYKDKEERYLHEELYKITSITAHLDDAKNITYRYSLNSTPQLNNRTHMWISSVNVDEEDLVKVKNY